MICACYSMTGPYLKAASLQSSRTSTSWQLETAQRTFGRVPTTTMVGLSFSLGFASRPRLPLPAGAAAAADAVAAARLSSASLAEPSLLPLMLPGASRRRSTVYPVSSARKVMRCTVPSTLTPAAAASIALGAAAAAAAAGSPV